jgi:hypothetical protein
MERQDFHLPASERACQAVSSDGDTCNLIPATVHCPNCGEWFCEAHAEDEHWHPCALEPGDEGGEG